MKPRYADTAADVARFNIDMTGVHEAGHAVVARTVGLTVASIHVSGTGGMVTLEEHENPDAELIVCYAGMEAQARFMRQFGGYDRGPAYRIARRHARDDLRRSKGLADRASISRSTAQRRARRLVARHWRQICRTGLRLTR